MGKAGLLFALEKRCCVASVSKEKGRFAPWVVTGRGCKVQRCKKVSIYWQAKSHVTLMVFLPWVSSALFVTRQLVGSDLNFFGFFSCSLRPFGFYPQDLMSKRSPGNVLVVAIAHVMSITWGIAASGHCKDWEWASMVPMVLFLNSLCSFQVLFFHQNCALLWEPLLLEPVN